MSAGHQAALEAVQDSVVKDDARDAKKPVPPGDSQSQLASPPEQPATDGGERTNSQFQTCAETPTDDASQTQFPATEAPGTEDVKPPLREQHLDQDIVDFEVDDGDLILAEKPPPPQPHTSGEKPQPAKISWNEWAGADAMDPSKRAVEAKDSEKKDPSAEPLPISEERRHREGPPGRHHRYEPYPRNPRRTERDGSPPFRRPYREPHPRSNDVPLRRGTMSSASGPGMPPGMNYGKADSTRFVHSGSVKPMHPSARPVGPRGMPPGLGVPEGPPRNSASQGAGYHQPAEGRRPFVKDYRPRHSRSPPRYDRPPRQMSPPRFERYRRPFPALRDQDIMPPPPSLQRSRSPFRDNPAPYPQKGGFQRQDLRNRGQMGPPADTGRRRIDSPTERLRGAVPASPRRFIPHDKGAPYQRQQHLAGALQPDYSRGMPGNPGRHAPPGNWTPPYLARRPLSANPHHAGASRRTPSPVHPPGVRRPPHGSSPPPPVRQRRDVDGGYRRREPLGPPPDYFAPDRSRYPHGQRAEPGPDRRTDPPSGRYGSHRRDLPSSPGRHVKRQRQSPAGDQRFHRDSGRHRSNMDSPRENPVNPDAGSAVPFRYPENECAWFYVDPQGNTQGPCTISQFRTWLKTLAEDPKFEEEHKQFMSVEAWKDGEQKKQLMTRLLQHNNP